MAELPAWLNAVCTLVSKELKHVDHLLIDLPWLWAITEKDWTLGYGGEVETHRSREELSDAVLHYLYPEPR